MIQMSFREAEDAFDRPIAGMALTHELGARPWQTSPEYPTIEEALDFYIPRLTDESFINRLIDIIEMGIPLTSLAEVITLGGVMQGLHTVDVAVLVNPVLVELMEGIAKKAGIDYRLGDVDGENLPDKMLMSKVRKALKNTNLTEEDEKDTTEKVIEVETEEEVTEAPVGLMSRSRGEK